MARPALLCALAIGWLAACAPAPFESTATPNAAPSHAKTNSPTETPSATTTAADPTPAPPERGIEWHSPGPDSVVASPILLHVLVAPGADRVHIELITADGDLLYRRVLAPEGIELREEIDFEVDRASQSRLTVLLLDEHGRIVAANSAGLELLPAGQAGAQPGSGPQSEIVIERPADGARLVENQVVVVGRVSASVARPLTIQAVAPDGRVLASLEVYPGEEEAEGYRSFEAVLPLNAEEESELLITASLRGGSVPGIWLLTSVEVELP